MSKLVNINGRGLVVVLCVSLLLAGCSKEKKDPVVADASGSASLGEVTSVAMGRGFTCAKDGFGKVKCWGDNSYGQLGQDFGLVRIGDEPGELGSQLPMVDLGDGFSVKSLAAGSAHACALLSDDTIKCWGHNNHGQLGQGDTDNRGDAPGEMGGALPVVDLGSGRYATAVAAGDGHTCVLLDNQSVKCWGYNWNGQLGAGDNNSRGDAPNEMGDALHAIDLGTGRTALSISAGGAHSCALLDTYDVKCWGSNLSGQLGQGDQLQRGDGPNEMGDNLPAIDLDTNRTALMISAGGAHTCALLGDFSAKCWGQNAFGQLGQGDTNNRGDEPDEMGDKLPAIAVSNAVSAAFVFASNGDIATGNAHTCLRLKTNSKADRIKCWGSNFSGQLGLGDTDHRGDNPGEMGGALPAIDLSTLQTDQSQTAVLSGPQSNSVCAVLSERLHACFENCPEPIDNHGLKCWGGNDMGQLGLGDSNDRGDEIDEMGDALPFIKP